MVVRYQGGHNEYFSYMVDLLKARGGEHIQVFGGGGGVINLVTKKVQRPGKSATVRAP